MGFSKFHSDISIKSPCNLCEQSSSIDNNKKLKTTTVLNIETSHESFFIQDYHSISTSNAQHIDSNLQIITKRVSVIGIEPTPSSLFRKTVETKSKPIDQDTITNVAVSMSEDNYVTNNKQSFQPFINSDLDQTFQTSFERQSYVAMESSDTFNLLTSSGILFSSDYEYNSYRYKSLSSLSCGKRSSQMIFKIPLTSDYSDSSQYLSSTTMYGRPNVDHGIKQTHITYSRNHNYLSVTVYDSFPSEIDLYQVLSFTYATVTDLQAHSSEQETLTNLQSLYAPENVYFITSSDYHKHRTDIPVCVSSSLELTNDRRGDHGRNTESVFKRETQIGYYHLVFIFSFFHRTN